MLIENFTSGKQLRSWLKIAECVVWIYLVDTYKINCVLVPFYFTVYINHSYSQGYVSNSLKKSHIFKRIKRIFWKLSTSDSSKRRLKNDLTGVSVFCSLEN